MIEVVGKIEVAVSADRAWRLLGGFDSLPLWIPMIETSVLEEGGRVRYLTAAGGITIRERMLTFDEQARLYTYAYVEGPDPVKNYIGKVSVEEKTSDSCVISWGSRFEPAGLSESEAIERYGNAYKSSVTHAKSILEA
ncbi:MAG: SRPBCC family protein [Zymomonas mobilis subsp. pomaceae]|uniref:SRPBCC family protein n=1 Tax=Zymomonas mobilis TaxID=542 RepID=UPI0039EBDC58